MPAFVQDDERLRFSAEPFIVFRSTPGSKHPCSRAALRRRETGRVASITRTVGQSLRHVAPLGSGAIRVSPAFAFAAANIVIRTSVEPDPGEPLDGSYRGLAEFHRSSTIAIEGDRAPKTMMVEFRNVPPGEYEVTAMLIGADGHRRAMARAHINVLESGAGR